MMKMFWLSNPLANHLFGPLATIILGLFVLAALALLAFQVGRMTLPILAIPTPAPAVSNQVLWQRYLTWAIIAPLFLIAVLSGPLAVALLCAFLCWQGGREYADLMKLPASHGAALVLSGWATLAAALIVGSAALVAAPVLAFFGWSLVALRSVKGEQSVEKRFGAALVGLWGSLYIGWLPAYLVALSVSASPGLVLAVGLGVALSDVGAFCCGKALGGPRLAPTLSPNKTWGGVAGNFLGAALALALLTFALPDFQLWQRCLLALAIGVGSIWGDLLESLLKRQGGVKDAGRMLPGFGGLLDRIDSLLMAAPLVYAIALLITK
ncbi:MAG TPA: phosphatidate cytidylyltransferase [Ktedonobacterales bacterium]|nr:phosphatidate cytidylyltransferase [Ktedonobacterales bacterium]